MNHKPIQERNRDSQQALAGAYATFVVFAWRDRVEDEIPAERVAEIDAENRRVRGQALREMEVAS